MQLASCCCDLSKHVANSHVCWHAGSSYLLLNGMAVDISTFDLYALIDQIRSEVGLSCHCSGVAVLAEQHAGDRLAMPACCHLEACMII